MIGGGLILVIVHTGGEADDPDVEEIEVGDAGVGLVHLVQPAPGAPLPKPPPRLRRQQRGGGRRRRRQTTLAAAVHSSLVSSRRDRA